MGIFLDGRTSQNASLANSSAVPILVGTESLFGGVGLQVGQQPPGIIRVNFNGTIAVQLPLLPVLTSVTIEVVRGTEETGLTTVYSAEQQLSLEILGPQVISFNGADFNPPKPANGQLVYRAYITASAVGTVRVGPESFNAYATAG
ncbi:MULTISPECIES: hypothetical protein [Bacillus]|uniref:Exosporium protein C n=1 Tax=Bacillus infantis NRRL B-14911 TaxID=1367477 RepID=U5L986_9BACI|nr:MULTISPECIES: hypothetical protein [Bacillus]AGX03975.1 hypothetical protein N288_10300 [Bacillus infantis NRRL B-14911]EAR63447.1 hypothetical protein B14911_09182 [Bacillus sp. NRRL B-14911]MCA1037546.1 hypothetical protein [Bacillus infantis]MCK6206307.1 hypothetical protein [Bacillus infantis]